jgi:Zn-dependent protease with chaperone function
VAQGFYFDGRSSRRHLVHIGVDAEGISIAGEAGDHVFPWSACTLSERTRHGPRQIELGAGARLEIPEPTAFNAALAALGRRDSVTVRMQQSWRIVLLSLAGCVLAVAAAYVWLLPWGAGVVADRLPQSVLVQASDQAMGMLDELVMKPSRLPDDRQARLRQRMVDIMPKHAQAELVFRDGGRLGANALALPSGKIIVTDQLAALLDDEQLVGVMAHEIGHVVYRHGMRKVLQDSVVALLAGWYLGDISSILAGSAATYANLHYSRDFEFQADAYGASLLRANGMPPALLAGALEKLEASHTARGARSAGKDTASRGKDGADKDVSTKDTAKDDDYWATHPGTAERVRRLLTRED